MTGIGIGVGIGIGIGSGQALATAPPNAPTIGAATVSYNDRQGNIFSVSFTPSGSGQAASSYLVTLSTGETKSGQSSPIVFINTLSNDVARTATVKAVNSAGQSAASSASNSATPVSILRSVVAQNRTYYKEESRTKTGVVDLRGVIVGSGAIKDFAPMFHGWYESFSTGLTNCSAAYTINEMSVYSGANTPVAVTWGGLTSKVINPGDTEIIADLITPAQLLGVGVTQIPQGTVIWYKFRYTLANTSAGALCTADLVADFPGSQHAFYDPGVTTITNTSATQGAWTATGTALETTRPEGMVPQTVGHYVNGDPATFLAVGDSIIAAANQDEVAKTTGRCWFNNLMVQPDGSVLSAMNCAVANDFTVRFSTNTKIHALAKYCRFGVVEPGTNDLAQQGTGNVTTIHNAEKVLWSAMKSNSIGGGMILIRTYLLPRSESAGPPKTINSAPNTQWGVGEKAAQLHALYAQDVIDGLIDYFWLAQSVRQGSDPSQVEFWLWKYNGGANVFDTIMTTDGIHTKNAGVLAIVSDYRPLLSQLL